MRSQWLRLFWKIKITVGGGAVDIAIALALRDFAPSVGGRGQMAVAAFANAVEVIPKTLSENAGLDPIDIMLELRREHKKGHKYAGVDVLGGKVTDMMKHNVIEPLRVTVHEIQTATETATMILRIDDVIAAKGGTPSPPGGPGGMPPGGMGGMEEY